MSEKKYISKVTRDAEEKRISGNRLVFEALEKRVLLSADIGLMLPDADQGQLLDAELYQPEEFIDTVLLESEATPLNTEPTLTIEAPEPVSGTEESEVVPVAGEEPASAELIHAAEQSIAAPVKEIVFVDSTVDGYEELLQSLFAADEEQQPEKASSAEQYLLSETQQETSAAPTESQTKAPKTALPQQISADQQARQLRSNIEIYLLNPNADGVTQIADVLSGYEGLAAVHLISHGSTGTLRIGNSQLSTASLTKYSERLKAWGQSMASGADILLYGCNVAEGETGVTFVKNLAYLTGADVAASDDETGAGLAGGDWLLEASTGVIEAQFNAATDYEHLLASKNIDGTANEDTFTFAAGEVTGANADSDKPTPASVTYTSTDTVQITGAGEDDTFKFTAIPSAGAIKLDGGTGSDTLDFSAIDKELFFTVKGSKGNVTVEYKDGGEFKLLLTAKNVEEIIGGTLGDTFLLAKKATLEGGIQGMGGNDTIIFSAGAKIGGKLDGGGGDNNTLAYSYHNENDRPNVEVALDKKFFSSDDGGYKTKVKVDLKQNSATGIYSGKADGIDNISSVIGGRSNSIITGSDQGDTVTTKAGDNQLEGGQGDDTFDSTLNSGLDIFAYQDGWGSDVITNTTGHKDLLYLREVTKKLTIDVKENAVMVTSEDGSTVHGNSAKTEGVTGIDKIIGGVGDNTYRFFDKWNSNTVIDDTKAGLAKGTLDLSAVTHDLVFRIIGPGTVLVSAAVTEDGVVSEYKVTATGIANITGGQGNNQYKFEGDGSIAGKLIGGAAQETGQVNLLDYSSYGQAILLNLTNTAVEFSDAAPVITKDKDSAGNVVNGVLPKQESWTYTVAGLKGTLTLDKTTANTSFDFSSDHESELDEQLFKKAMIELIGRSDFSVTKTTDVLAKTSKFQVLFSEPQKILTAPPAIEEFTRVTPGKSEFVLDLDVTITAPVDNKEQFIRLPVNADEGKFLLKYDGNDLNTVLINTGVPIDGPAVAAQIKSALEGVTGIAGAYTVAVSHSIDDGEHQWKIEFTAKVGVDPLPALKRIESGTTNAIKTKQIALEAAREVEGSAANNATWSVANSATGGTLSLKVEFKDLSGTALALTTKEIKYNASPEAVQGALRDAILEEIQNENAKLDVVPQILVAGMGTTAYPWKITFANMGEVTVTVEASDFIAIGKVWEGSATGISSAVANAVAGITHVIGSGSGNDRIYGVEQASKEAAKFKWNDVGVSIADDKQTLKIKEKLSLRTGQAILYKASGSLIKGLDSGKVYFISYEFDGVYSSIRFYASADEIGKLDNAYINQANAIELSAPATTGDDQILQTVMSTEGGIGADTLIAFVDNNANAILGGIGDDVIVGSNGSDYLDGGAGNDTIYGDGEHHSLDEGDGEDTILGGAGNDSIYGYIGEDHLQGGKGNDYLVGGTGSDRVEGGAGDDTLAIIEGGNHKDYDLLIGGKGNDSYVFKGDWGTASLKESGSFFGSSNTIDLSSSSENTIHVLSNGSYFSAPGEMVADQIYLDGDSTGERDLIALKDPLESLTGSHASSGEVLTQWGFGLHQVSSADDSKGVLKGFGKVVLGAEINEQYFRLWVDRGNGPIIYEVTVPAVGAGGYADIDAAKAAVENALIAATGVSNKAELASETGLSVSVNGGRIQITATDDGAYGDDKKLIAATMELTVKGHEVVAVGGKNNFENIGSIKLGSGGNTFVFGNDYWGGGSTKETLAQAVPLLDMLARNTQDQLTIDTKNIHAEEAPLVLDFRSVNHELYFNFSSNGSSDSVTLTVQTLRDLTLPIVGLGPEIRNNTIVFTDVDKNTTVYGGRYKNTFNFDRGATYQGHLIGGEGYGPLTNFAGHYTDKILDAVALVESVGTGLSLADLIDSAFFQVDNSFGYSSFGIGAPVTKVNLATLDGEASAGSSLNTAAQIAAGNIIGPVIDKYGWTTTTGLTGLAENYKHANLGDVVVRSGINLVRGTDYDFGDISDTFSGDLGALLTSGSDTLSIGDNPFSIAPGFHFLAGGSGADTYVFNNQFWLGALIIDDLYTPSLDLGEVGDAIVDGLIPNDTLDFANIYQDLYYTVVEVSINDIQAIREWAEGNEAVPGDGFPIDVGTAITLVTSFDPFDGSGEDEEFRLSNVLSDQALIGNANIALAIGVENINGGRGANTVYFVDGAKLGGRIAPGFGGTLALDYSRYNGLINPSDGIETDLDVIDGTVFPAAFFADELPEWAQSLFPSVEYTYGSATGSGGGSLGIVEGGNVVGTEHADEIHANKDDNEITAGDGDDTVSGEAGEDTIDGGRGNDELHGGEDADIITGGDGNDDLYGDEGNDNLTAGAGDDFVDGGEGEDTYHLSVADDANLFLIPGLSRDWITSAVPTEGSAVSIAGGTNSESDPWQLTHNWGEGAAIETDALVNIETILINSASTLPTDAVIVTQDSAVQTISINPEGFLGMGIYHLYVDADDVIDMLGYGSQRIDLGVYDSDQKEQTLVIYATEEDKNTSTNPLLTLKVSGRNEALVADHFDFTPTSSLLAEQTLTEGSSTYQLLEQDLFAIRTEAISRWTVATGNGPEIVEYLNNLVFSISDLDDQKLAQIYNNHVRIDADAAGAGWFVDSTPASDEEFSMTGSADIALADADSDAYARYDLLTVMMHEIGHSLGLSDSAETNLLMSQALPGGARASIQLDENTQLTLDTVQNSSSYGSEFSDETMLVDGLNAFATWAEDNLLGVLANSIELPFIGSGFGALWDLAAGDFTAGIAEGIRSEILSVFGPESTVTTEDLLALSSVSASDSHRLSEFTGRVSLANESQSLDINLDMLADMGLDLSAFVGLTMSESLQVNASIDLQFGFGIDASTGKFFIEAPALIAEVKAGHENPLDVSLAVGPLGIGIEDGIIAFQASVLAPTEGRYGVDDLDNFVVGDLGFGQDSGYQIDLPFVLEGALAGLADEVGRLHGAFNSDGNSPVDISNLSPAQFFTMIPQTLNFEGDNFDALMDLSNVSLDAAIEGIKSLLQSAISKDGAAYKELPFLNKSAVDLLGNDSADFVQAIVDALDTVQSNLSDINHFEIDLNQEINSQLGLGLEIGGDELDHAYDEFVALSPGLLPQSTDEMIAVAMAEKLHATDYESLQLDRDLVGAYDRLQAYGLDGGSNNQEIAEAIADSALLASLTADRDLLSADPDFINALEGLSRYGFDATVSDTEIDAYFDVADMVTEAEKQRGLLIDADSSDDEKLLARMILARMGIVINDGVANDAIAAIDFFAVLNKEAEAAIAKADRDLVVGRDASLADAAERLQASGLSGNSSDSSLAIAVAGIENLQQSYDDRDLLADSEVVLADAQASLLAAGLSSESSDGDLARTLIDAIAYEQYQGYRDILTQYDASKAIDLFYQNSVLDLSFGIHKAVSGNYDLEFDLEDLPGLGELLTGNDVLTMDLNSDGQVFVDADMDLDLNFSFDLSSLGNPELLVYDDSQITFNRLTIETLEPVDIEAEMTLLPEFSVGGETLSMTLAIDDGEIFVDLNGAISLVEGDDGYHHASELVSNSSLWNVDLIGEIDADLPFYFPTADTPLGGTDRDLNGDGYADNLVHVDGLFRGENDFDFNFITPDLDFSGLFNVFAILNDPANVLLGFEGMFDGLKAGMSDRFDQLNLPLLGDALQDAPDFLDSLRDSLLSSKDSDGNYSGGLGKALQDEARKPEDERRSTIQLIQEGIYNTLGPGGLNILSAPLLEENPYTGKMEAVYAADGTIETIDILSPDDIQLTIEGGNLQFNVIISDEVFPTKTVGLDFGASLPGFDLNSDAGLEISMDYVFGLGFGFGSSGFYVDTTGISETGAEFALDLDAGLSGGVSANLFFLDADLTDYTGIDLDGNPFGAGDTDGLSGFNGSFDIDLGDSSGDGKWVIVGPGSDAPELNATLSAGLNVDLYAAASLPEINLGDIGLGDLVLELPSIETVIHYDQVLAEAVLGTDGISFDIGGEPELVFEAVTVDAGSFIESFIGPLISPIEMILEPIRPFIELLTTEIGFLTEIGADDINTIAKMIEIIPDPRTESISKVIKAFTAISGIIDEVSAFADAGELNFGDFVIDLSGGSSSTDSKPVITQSREDNSESSKKAKQKRDDFKNKKSVKDAGEFELTLLDDPFSAVGLLLGQDDVTLFKYIFPNADFNLEFGKSMPVFPGLNAGLNGSFEFNTDIAIGFDSKGLVQFLEEDFADPLVLFNGFFMDDHIEDGVDSPELTFGATIGASASLGLGGLVEAGVEGGIRGYANFDFNDFDNDGKFYADELLKRIDQGPLCIFDIDGAISAFLDAFIWVGLDLGFYEVTAYEYRESFINEVLADFTHHCPPPESPDIATLDDGELTLRYNGAGDDKAHSYSVQFVDELDLGSLYDYAGDLTDHDRKDNVTEELLKDKNGRALKNTDGSALKNQLVIKARGVVEVFDAAAITSIRAQGTTGDDRYRIGDSAIISGAIELIDIRSGAGDDTIDLGGESGTSAGQLTAVFIDAGAGNDKIAGSAAADVIYGGSGNDRIYGYGGDDYIYSVLDTNAANSEVGNEINQDVVEGGAGADTIYGGDGNDLLFGDFAEESSTTSSISGGDTLYGGDGNDSLYGGAGTDSLYGEAGDDNLLGQSGADYLDGGINNDRLRGHSGNDTLLGGGGRDFLEGGTGSDDVDGGLGTDAILWTNGDGSEQRIVGGNENDTFIIRTDGNSSDTVAITGSGADAAINFNGQLFSLEAFENIELDVGLGSDAVTINDLSETTISSVGVLLGSNLSIAQQTIGDEIFNIQQKTAENSADRITIRGGTNRDEFSLESMDQIDPETGKTVAIVRVTQANGVTFDIREIDRADDTLIVDGNQGNDSIDATGLTTDLIQDLRLLGDDGDDELIGSIFEETIIGGLGADRITGGLGVDLFLHDEHAEIAREEIADEPVVDTLIEYRDADFTLSNETIEITEGRVQAVESEALNGLFEAVELHGYAAFENRLDSHVNSFTLSGWSGHGLIDGGGGSDYYEVILAQSADDANFLNIDDSGVDGRDRLEYKGSTETDLIQMDTVYLQNNDPDREFSNDRWVDYGDHGDGLLIAHFGAALAGYGKKDLDDTESLFQVGVSSLTASDTYQAINYSTIEDVTVYGGLGNDVFISDDTASMLNVYGNEGDDQFYVGSIIETEDVLVEGQEITVVKEITHGASFGMKFYGGADDDYFEVNHNTADIDLYGDNGDDVFFIKALLTLDEEGNTFDLVGKETRVNAGKEVQDETDTREVDSDALVYVENANVNIDGGAGFDSVAVVGTALSDTFYVWAEEDLDTGETVQRIYGAGIKLNRLVNIERLMLLTGSGDDRVYINGVDLGPNADMVINLGSGSDEVIAGGPGFDFDVNFPKQNRIDYATLTGYAEGEEHQFPSIAFSPWWWGGSYNINWKPVSELDLSELIVSYTITSPAETEQETLPTVRTINAFNSPLTIIGGLGEVDRLTINNQDGPEELEFSNRKLQKKQITTDDSFITFPESSIVVVDDKTGLLKTGLLKTDLLNADLLNAAMAEQGDVAEMLADFLRNHILFQDKYIETDLIDRLQALTADDSMPVELPAGISYAVFQDTVDEDGISKLTAYDQLDQFLTGTGYVARFDNYVVPGSEGTEVFKHLTAIEHSDTGDQLAFESQKKSIKVDGIDRNHTIGISLLTASSSSFVVNGGYLTGTETLDEDAMNFVSVQGQSSNIFFAGFDEFNLNLNDDSASDLILDNNLFSGIVTVQGGQQGDDFTVLATAGQTLLRGGDGADHYSIGDGTIDAVNAELFLLGEDGNDSVVVNSEAVTSDTDLLLDKTYLEHSVEQEKLNKIGNLLGVGDSDAINEEESAQVQALLQQQTADYIKQIGLAGTELFDEVISLVGTRYAQTLLPLYIQAETAFGDALEQLKTDAENAYFANLSQQVEQYRQLLEQGSLLDQIISYREKIEQIESDKVIAEGSRDEARTTLYTNISDQYEALSADQTAEFDSLLESYTDSAVLLAGDFFSGLHEGRKGAINDAISPRITAYYDALQAVVAEETTYAAVAGNLTAIIEQFELDLATVTTASDAFDDYIDSDNVGSGEYRSALEALLTTYLADSDADSASFATDVAALTPDPELVDGLSSADFEAQVVTLADDLKSANGVIDQYESDYLPVDGISTLNQLVTHLNEIAAPPESTLLDLNSELTSQFGDNYSAEIKNIFDIALANQDSAEELLAILDDAHSNDRAGFNTLMSPTLDVYKQQRDVVSRATELLDKEALDLATVNSQLSDARGETTPDTELILHLESVQAHKQSESDEQVKQLALQSSLDNAKDDLDLYVKEQLFDEPPAAISDAYEALFADEELTVEELTQQLMIALDSELDTAFGNGASEAVTALRSGFENGLSGVVAAYVAGRDLVIAQKDLLDAFLATSSDVTTLKGSGSAASSELAAALLADHSLDVDDYLDSGMTLADYLDSDDPGGVNSTINAVSASVQLQLAEVLNAIDELSNADVITIEVAALKQAIVDFAAEIANIADSVSAEQDLVKSLARSLMPELGLEAIFLEADFEVDNPYQELDDLQARIEQNSPDLFSVVSRFVVASEEYIDFSSAQSLFIDNTGDPSPKDDLIALIETFAEFEKYAAENGLANASNLADFRDTQLALERMRVYANYLPADATIKIKKLFDEYGKNLIDYQEIATADARIEAIKVKAEAEAKLKSLKKDKVVVDRVHAKNSAAFQYNLQTRDWWYGYSYFYLGGSYQYEQTINETTSKYLETLSQKTELDNQIASLSSALGTANGVVDTASEGLDSLDEELSAQFLMIKVLNPVVLEVLSASRSGGEMKALLDADDSLIASIRSYSNQYQVVAEKGLDSNSDPLFSDANFSTVTSQSSTRNYSDLLSLTGLNEYGIHLDHQQVESFELNLGSANEQIRVASSLGQPGSLVQLNLADGDEIIHVGDTLDTHEKITGALQIDAGPGTHWLTIDDSGDVTGDTITQNYAADGYIRIDGMSDGSIFYKSIDGFENGLSITTSAGDDDITVAALHGADHTELFSIEGDDTIRVVDFAVNPAAKLTIDSGDGDDLIDASLAPLPVTLFGAAGNDSILGSSFADLIYGHGGDDTLSGGAGDDIIFGDEGNIEYTAEGFIYRVTNKEAEPDRDAIEPVVGHDRIDGGSGNDLQMGGAGKDELRGGKGDDILVGDGGIIEFYQNKLYRIETTDFDIGDDDTLVGGAGTDYIFGGQGSDTIYGNLGDDVLAGDFGLFTSEVKGSRADLNLGQAGFDLLATTTMSVYATDSVEVTKVTPPQFTQPEKETPSYREPVQFGRYSGSHGGNVSAEAPESTATATKIHKVVAGDTLWDIAENYLGDVSLYPELLALNPWIENPDSIAPGQTIQLPATAKNKAENEAAKDETVEPQIPQAQQNEAVPLIEGITLAAVARYGAHRTSRANGLYIIDDKTGGLKPSYRGAGKSEPIEGDIRINWDH